MYSCRGNYAVFVFPFPLSIFMYLSLFPLYNILFLCVFLCMCVWVCARVHVRVHTVLRQVHDIRLNISFFFTLLLSCLLISSKEHPSLTLSTVILRFLLLLDFICSCITFPRGQCVLTSCLLHSLIHFNESYSPLKFRTSSFHITWISVNKDKQIDFKVYKKYIDATNASKYIE